MLVLSASVLGLINGPPAVLRHSLHTTAVTAAAQRVASNLPSTHKKRHALLTFGFCGTGYYGLQSHTAEGDPQHPTVTDVVRRALLDTGAIQESNWSPLSRTKWRLASRTDKGVHAACAAASVMLETLEEEVQMHDETAAEGAHWELTPAGIARINEMLPKEVRVFSAGRVRKSFNAREQASSRTYEYLLPMSSLNGMPPAEFDAVLRTFEGTHKFHNFASGLRLGDGSEYHAGGETWPLALDPYSNNRNAHVFRSVICSRVHRQLSIEGEPYLVLRISGMAFVLHQIRHMVGTALAVAHGAVPRYAFLAALQTPFKVDVSPLAPGLGLLLDEIRWFDVGKGSYEAFLLPSVRANMERFKEEVIYPHVHSLISGSSAFDDFLAMLAHNDGHGNHYTCEDYARLGRILVHWEQEREGLVQQRKEEKEARIQAALAARAAATDGSIADTNPKSQRTGRRRTNNLPGGLLTSVCIDWGLVPGPRTHEMMEWVRARLATGELQERASTSYYLDALAREYPRPTYAEGKAYGTLENIES